MSKHRLPEDKKNHFLEGLETSGWWSAAETEDWAATLAEWPSGRDCATTFEELDNFLYMMIEAIVPRVAMDTLRRPTWVVELNIFLKSMLTCSIER